MVRAGVSGVGRSIESRSQATSATDRSRPSACPEQAHIADQVLYYSVRALSQFGQALYLGALLIAAGTGPSGPLGVSSIFAATLAAAVVFGLPGGALTDWFGPGRSLALGVWFRLATITAALVLIDHPSWIWVIAFAYSAGSQVFTSAEMALVATIDRARLTRAHLLLAGLQYAGQGAGVLALALLLLGGPHLALATAAGIYAVLVVLATILSVRVGRHDSARPRRADRQFAFRETFRFLRRERGALYALGLLAFVDIAAKGVIIAVPRYLTRDLRLDRTEVVVVCLFAGLGVCIGLLWAMRGFSLRAGTRIMRYVLSGIAGPLAALALLEPVARAMAHRSGVEVIGEVGGSAHVNLTVTLAGALVLGLCLSIAPIVGRAILSHTAPPWHQGRIFAAQLTISHAAAVLPLLGTGLGTEFAGSRPTLVLLALAGLVLLLILEWIVRRAPAPPSESPPAPLPVVTG